MDKANRGFNLVGLIVAIAAIAALAGAGWYWKKTQTQGPQMPPAQQANQPDVSDWKTYRNEKYGFEVRYPVSWKAESDAIDAVRDTKEGYNRGMAYFALYPPLITDATGYVKKLQFFLSDKPQDTAFIDSVLNKETRTLGENIWTIGQIPVGHPAEGAYLFSLMKDGKRINVAAYSLQDYEDVYYKILSTFKFIK